MQADYPGSFSYDLWERAFMLSVVCGVTYFAEINLDAET